MSTDPMQTQIANIEKSTGEKDMTFIYSV